MELISVDVKTSKTGLSKIKSEMLVVGVCQDDKKPAGLAMEADKALKGAISRIYKLGDFKAKASSTTVIYTNGALGTERLMLLGLGESKKLSYEVLRRAVSTAAKEAVGIGAKEVLIAVHQACKGLDLKQAGEVMAEALCFGAYRWDEFVSKGEEEKNAKKVVFEIIDTDSAALRQMEQGIKAGIVIGRTQNWARTIANQPGNVINPAKLADIAKKTAAQTAGLKCRVFDDGQLKKMGMNAILAVGSGSANKPRLIVLEYRGAKGSDKMVALVGKAITFDSGGISIKPSQGMEDMKLDKSGGVAVIASLRAAAELKLPVNVMGLIPSAENMPSGTSFRPGDILKTYSGKTVEIQNTDAEGRMILCDALAYAVKQKVSTIIDIATLTGACMVALGRYKAGVMSNNEDLVNNIKEAAKQSGEAVWELPCGDEYLDEVKSKIADLKNIGSRWGGACNAAAFLGQFTNNIPWAHIDMAGVDLFESPKSYTAVGSSGYGVRLLTSYLRGLKK